VGAWILDIPVGKYAFELSWDWFSGEFLMIWQPLILGCLICGTIAALLGIISVKLLWRLMVIRNWARRKNKQVD
jgi:hypothetical protein